MRKPGSRDISIVRGTTEPFTFRFVDDDDDPLPWNDVELVISRSDFNGVDILRLTLSGGGLVVITDTGKQYIQWKPTEIQSRLIPIGRLSFYEVQLTIGAEKRVYLVGRVTGIGGLNDDD